MSTAEHVWWKALDPRLEKLSLDIGNLEGKTLQMDTVGPSGSPQLELEHCYDTELLQVPK